MTSIISFLGAMEDLRLQMRMHVCRFDFDEMFFVQPTLLKYIRLLQPFRGVEVLWFFDLGGPIFFA